MQRHCCFVQHLPHTVRRQALPFGPVSDDADCLPHDHNNHHNHYHDHQPVLVAVERLECVVPVMRQRSARPLAGMQRHCGLVQYIPHTLRRQANAFGPVSDHSDCLPHDHNHDNHNNHDHQPVLVAVERMERVVAVMR